MKITPKFKPLHELLKKKKLPINAQHISGGITTVLLRNSSHVEFLCSVDRSWYIHDKFYGDDLYTLDIQVPLKDQWYCSKDNRFELYVKKHMRWYMVNISAIESYLATEDMDDKVSSGYLIKCKKPW